MTQNKYRFDGRSEAEFKVAMKHSHRVECDIIIRIGVMKFKELGYWLDITPTGVDFTGNFIRENKKIVNSPDYKIGEDSVEITRSNNYCNYFFHEKVGKVNNIIEKKQNIVFINGYDPQKESSGLWLNAEQLDKYTKLSVQRYGIAKQPLTLKPVYKYKISDFDGMWFSLPMIDVELPESYICLLDALEG